MKEKVTVGQVVELLNREQERLRAAAKDARSVETALLREYKADQCAAILSRITAHEAGVRAITRAGDPW